MRRQAAVIAARQRLEHCSLGELHLPHRITLDRRQRLGMRPQALDAFLAGTAERTGGGYEPLGIRAAAVEHGRKRKGEVDHSGWQPGIGRRRSSYGSALASDPTPAIDWGCRDASIH